MKEEVINKQGKHNSDVLNLKREVSMYKQLLDKQSVNAQIDKRRIMMEELVSEREKLRNLDLL
jgi:hypothetical protein